MKRRPIGLLLGLGALLVLTDRTQPQTPAPLPAAPKGFDAERANIERGKLETVEYDSKTVGAKRKMTVYTPPGYSKDGKYPVLYLLHGKGGKETDWTKKGAAATILDNLYADKKVVPMIVVMPHGEPPVAEGKTRMAIFEGDLRKDIIPYIESHYPAKADREHRAVAGLSMGGGQALSIGLRNLDEFAWVGGFSSALLGKTQPSFVPDPDAATKRLRLLWVSCGDKDTLWNSNKAFHDTLEEKKVPHVWHVDSGAHTWPVWRNDIYLLMPMLFREK